MESFFDKNTKLKDFCLLYIVILKDKENNIPATMSPSKVFQLNSKDVYILGKIIKEDFKNSNSELIRKIESRMEDILNKANRMYNKWTDLKIQVNDFKPTVSVCYTNYAEPCIQATRYVLMYL